jgi:hypothetical protein
MYVSVAMDSGLFSLKKAEDCEQGQIIEVVVRAKIRHIAT